MKTTTMRRLMPFPPAAAPSTYETAIDDEDLMHIFQAHRSLHWS